MTDSLQISDSDLDIDIVQETQFKLTPLQKIFVVILLLTLATFATSTFLTSRDSISQAQVLANAESTSSSIIFTQRETLVYAARFSSWLAGSTDRRSVQIARALLAQRLNVIDAAGTNIGSRLNSEFMRALRQSDDLLASAPSGFLSGSLRSDFTSQSEPILNSIIFNARVLIESYQHAADKQFRAKINDKERAARFNLALLVGVIAMALTLFLWVGYTTRAQYRRGRRAIRAESRALVLTRNELNRVQESLMHAEGLNQAKNEFISTINHELRTPLTSIIGFIELIRKKLHKEVDATEIEPLMETLDRNATVLLDLVEGALSISQLDSDAPAGNFKPVNIVTNIESVLFALKPVIVAKEIEVLFPSPKTDFIVSGDFGQLSQVFMNLISNAVKFSSVKSTIRIHVEERDELYGNSMVCVGISDQGIGIPNEDIPQLFSRFFRARNAVNEQIPGTGLGLAIVEKIVRLHGGTFGVKSQLGAGSEFEIHLPKQLSKSQQLIINRKPQILQSAITRIEGSSLADFLEVTHDVGGLIGFYSLVEEGLFISDVSQKAEQSDPLDQATIDIYKTEILNLLYEAQRQLEKENK